MPTGTELYSSVITVHCAYTNSTEKGLGQHTRMKYRISQLDGNFDLVEGDSE